MTIVPCYSTLSGKFASIERESICTTSSHILLSRAVAASGIEPAFLEASLPDPPESAALFESNTPHITPVKFGTLPYMDAEQQAEDLSDPSSGEPASYKSTCTAETLCITEGSARKNSGHTNAFSAGQLVDTSRGQEIERGRTFHRTPRIRNPLDRAESRKRKHDVAVEVGVRFIKPRFSRSSSFFDDPTNPCAAFEDHLLEPCPHDSICNSVAEMIETPERNIHVGGDTSTPGTAFLHTNSNSTHDFESADRSSSTGTQTSLFRYCKPVCSVPTLTPGAVLELLPDVRHTEYHAPNSLSQLWSSTALRAPRHSAAALLPAEIMHQIYFNLSPPDFNSARHICRSWYINSLDRALLQTMLKRGGWSSSTQCDVSNPVLDCQVQVNDEWLMSKLLSRECALGPDWTGNGLNPAEENLPLEYHSNDPKGTPFVRASTTDFTEVGVHYPGVDQTSSGMSFTVSSCGKFLMVAHGCLIYIYQLNRSHRIDAVEENQCGALKPITAIICPRRVLACSMDTSSHHYAIAVLMDGRMGLVCDITGVRGRSRRSSSIRFQTMQGVPVLSGSEYRNRVSISSSRPRDASRTGNEQRFVFPIIAAEASQSRFPIELEQGPLHDTYRSGIPSGSMRCIVDSPPPRSMSFYDANPQDDLEPLPFHCSMPIESSTPIIYAPLCSSDDLPRSVALCPQRRCVAFGCSSGIELHWVDALTGQDLNRWFPLAAPSDYLYFLPPRAGIDSAKKLRLISSAGRPGERPVIADKFGGSQNGSKPGEKIKATPFWDVLTGYSGGWRGFGPPDREGSRTLRRGDSDHYRAVPLSDGYHILFTDPATGLLCLGSDAPVGGPTKLLRKIWFTGPKRQGSPVAYTAGRDLRWGVRVVAAYGQGAEQTIWLFSVPDDVFTNCQADRGINNMPLAGLSSWTETGNREWAKWWCDTSLHEWLEPTCHGTMQAMILRKDKIWPVQVRGQEIGRCHGLMDIAIDAGPLMTIWAFEREGVAHTWQIDRGELAGTVRKKFVILRDGTVRESDATGGVEMVDAQQLFNESPAPPGMQAQDTFDGTASMTNPGILRGQHLRCHRAGSGPNVATYDADGDVLMADLPHPERQLSDSQSDDSFEAAALTHGTRQLLHHKHSFLGCSSCDEIEENGLDLIDVLTGIARIDIEVR